MPFLAESQPPSYRVFDTYQGSDGQWMKYRHLDNAWYDHISDLSAGYLHKRREAIGQCTTLPEWEERKRIVKQTLLESIGGLPATTPLNARVVEVLDRDSFLVEKILYESLPGFYVTACLFLPRDRQQPAPAVIYCSGHTAEGFRSDTYQHVMLNLVKKGFVVLAFDPIGQGERYQYLDSEGEPDLGRSTQEHSYAGIQCLLTGSSIARYFIHDGIRAVDYLLSRPEVDPERIGITGRSGGGTQSAYIAAFDDRIYAAAPENYLTSFRRIWESIGPQDAEQDLPALLSRGLDHADFLEVRAPKPALMLTTTRDFFSIQGARETFAEVQQFYRLHGAASDLYYAEDDHGHGSTRANREAMYAFFQKYLALPGDPTDREVQPFSPEELTITSTGQVGSALDSKTIFDLNLAYHSQTGKEPVRLEEAMTNLIATGGERSRAVFTGRFQEEGLSIEKYFLEFSEDRYPVPFLWVEPARTNSDSLVLFLDSRGKSAAMEPGGRVEQWVRSGYTVLVPDLLHIGELGDCSFRGDSQLDNISLNLILGSSLAGTSLPVLQATDILALTSFIRSRSRKTPFEIIARADGPLCVPMVLAAAAGAPLEALLLDSPLVSWKHLLTTERYDPRSAYTIVPGALSHFDLPDLLAKIAPIELTVNQPVNARGEPLNSDEAAEAYRKVINTFSQTKRREDFNIYTAAKND